MCFLMFMLGISCYSQKASVRLKLIDQSSLDISKYIFQVRITNNLFDKYWVQDTTFIASVIANPSINLLHIFVEKRTGNGYKYFSKWKNRSGYGLSNKCLDSCCNCIILLKGQSVSANFNILEGCRIEKGKYRVQIGIVPPLFVCNGCAQLAEISSNYVYIFVK
jgi:hypothetical protein